MHCAINKCCSDVDSTSAVRGNNPLEPLPKHDWRISPSHALRHLAPRVCMLLDQKWWHQLCNYFSCNYCIKVALYNNIEMQCKCHLKQDAPHSATRGYLVRTLMDFAASDIENEIVQLLGSLLATAGLQ